MNRKYSPEMRERALRMLAEARPEHPNMMSAFRHVAGLLGMSPETLRLWQRRYEVPSRPGPEDARVRGAATVTSAPKSKSGNRIGSFDDETCDVAGMRVHDEVRTRQLEHFER